jgi:hypothetical protein
MMHLGSQDCHIKKMRALVAELNALGFRLSSVNVEN